DPLCMSLQRRVHMHALLSFPTRRSSDLTPGHVSVLIESRGERAVITGDLMHNPIQIAVPAVEARFDMDKAQGARTRVEFVERFNRSGTLVIGSHFADPSAGHIVPDGAAWKLEVK